MSAVREISASDFVGACDALALHQRMLSALGEDADDADAFRTSALDLAVFVMAGRCLGRLPLANSQESAEEWFTRAEQFSEDMKDFCDALRGRFFAEAPHGVLGQFICAIAHMADRLPWAKTDTSEV